MGRRINKSLRDVNGIVLVDKPVGISSNNALQQVKRLFKAQKAGHTGSLDPLASGLLVICFGEATKVSAYLLDADKRYVVSTRLGIKTSSGDAAGEILHADGPIPSRSDIDGVLDQFRGEISQIPPMFSALKHKGQRLYELARIGVEVERKPRKITIRSLEMTAMDEQSFDLDVRCTKGTYVRTLVEDISEAAGSYGHVASLRRLVVGPFEGSDMLTIEQIEQLAEGGPEALDTLLLPIDSAISDWPSVKLGKDAAWYLQQGQAVSVPVAPESGWVRLYGAQSRFIGIGEVTPAGQIAPKRIFKSRNGCL